MKTERMTILVTPAQKTSITRKARALQLSAGEVVRRAVESYRGDGDEEAVLRAMAEDLYRAAREARAAMKAAREEVEATLGYFAAKRPPGRSRDVGLRARA